MLVISVTLLQQFTGHRLQTHHLYSVWQSLLLCPLGFPPSPLPSRSQGCRTQALSGEGNRLVGGWGFNKRQPASALFGLQIIAGWCSIILQPNIAVERKVGRRKERGEGAGKGGTKRNSGRAPKGEKGLVNTKIIFINITGAAAA